MSKTTWSGTRVVLGAALISFGLAGSASAADGKIGVELNRLQQMDATCRLSLVFTNRLDVTIDQLELETVLFDPDGGAMRFLVLKSQPLIPGKIRVSQYDLADTQCSDVGSVLINDVVGCKGEGLGPATCLAKLAPSSRTDAALILTVSDQGKTATDGAEATQ
ncbi:hypothetical protein [Afifella marina]|uniref:Tat pathway signal sequence domain protein n=1 Tax=Afifella marina DSM 2698 TaxID=1120955 RepID=A0A1G5MLE5_AFIMA|nr:hypothetical protein [Afifella marina]SCZ26037.1 hypothetical protein SAMN03080610_00894 [Afifella marina DSM 2698]